MKSRWGLLTALAVLLVPFRLAAAEDAAAQLKAQQRVYDGLMSDRELYVGEGVVTLTSFADDVSRAKTSGRERARANMVESIRVRVVSKTTDTQSNGADGSKEEVKAESSSSADLELEGVQYKVLEAFPKEGQLTVLAYLSKEEWQRQNDKRLLGYRPRRALRISGGIQSSQALDGAIQKWSQNPPSGSTVSAGEAASGFNSQLGLGLYWDGWITGLALDTLTKAAVLYEPWDSSSGPYVVHKKAFNIVRANVGYEWTPWATRLQLAIPLQLDYALLAWGPYSAQAFGVAGGVRLRYWASDRVALDAGGLWHQGLGDAAITDGSHDLQYAPGELGRFSDSGPQVSIGVLWNGF